jgi:hypothetical protein
MLGQHSGMPPRFLDFFTQPAFKRFHLLLKVVDSTAEPALKRGLD